MRMIKIAVCDDEPLMVQELSGHLLRYMEERSLSAYNVETFSSGRQLLEGGLDFDLIFLDIQMERPDGMETARMLRRRENHSLLVFVTVLRECALDAFEVEAYDYLIKPLDAGRFRRTMDRALETLGQRAKETILIRRGASCEVVHLDNILYCEVQGRKIYIHQSDGSVVDYYERMDALQQRLDGRFFRCHRSYLVNLTYVRGSRAGQVILPQGSQIPVSRLREQELTQALLRYMKERDF